MCDIIEKKGFESALQWYKEQSPSDQKYLDDEGQLNNLAKYYYYKKGDAEKAIKLLELNKRKYDRSFSLHKQLGDAYYKLGEKQKALQAFKTAFEINPFSEHAQNRVRELEPISSPQ